MPMLRAMLHTTVHDCAFLCNMPLMPHLPQEVRLDIHHPASADCGWRSNSEILNLKYHVHQPLHTHNT